jgi:hypothetical protein
MLLNLPLEVEINLFVEPPFEGGAPDERTQPPPAFRESPH